MAPVLRKRKAPQPAPEPPAKVSKVSKTAAAKSKAPAAPKAAKSAAKANGAAAPAAKSDAPRPVVGDVITLDGFGGEVETNDGKKTSLKALVDESKSGVVLFTYPKASTPGCTTQVCLFRDSYTDLTAGGLSVYGLSSDSPKANTTFKEKQKLPYPLLCDPAATLIGAIGLAKTPRGTTRGVFVVDKNGKVLAAQPGGPALTLQVAKALLDEQPGNAEDNGKEEKGEEAKKEEAKDDAAAGAAEPVKNGDAAEAKEETKAAEEAKE